MKYILVAKGFNKPVLIISVFHMERSVTNFAKAGIKVTPVPADYQVSRQSGMHINKFVPTGNGMHFTFLAAKEYLGLAALRLAE